MTGEVLEEEGRILSKAGRGDLASEGSKVWESRRWVLLISRDNRSPDCGLHRCARLWLWVFWKRPWGERMISYMMLTYIFESCRFKLLIVEYTAGKILFLIARLLKVLWFQQSIVLSIYLCQIIGEFFFVDIDKILCGGRLCDSWYCWRRLSLTGRRKPGVIRRRLCRWRFMVCLITLTRLWRLRRSMGFR